MIAEADAVEGPERLGVHERARHPRLVARQPGDLTPVATEDDDESEDAWQLTDRRDER